MLLSLIFYIKITIMRIIHLRAASSPAQIEWDTLSQFLPPGIIKSHSSCSSQISTRRLYKLV